MIGLLGAMPLAAQAPRDPVTLGPVRVQLFYQFSGRLSRDIAPPAKFELWNVGAGEGSAEEPAEDVLVTVPLTMKPSDMAIFAPAALTITARNQAGKILGERRFSRENILVPVMGRTHAAMWLNNIQCAGRVTFEARYGAQVKRTVLTFSCGE